MRNFNAIKFRNAPKRIILSASECTRHNLSETLAGKLALNAGYKADQSACRWWPDALEQPGRVYWDDGEDCWHCMTVFRCCDWFTGLTNSSEIVLSRPVNWRALTLVSFFDDLFNVKKKLITDVSKKRFDVNRANNKAIKLHQVFKTN